MTERTEQIVALTRRELARLHASELNAALFPKPGLSDDDVSDEEKEVIQINVKAIREQHGREIESWVRAHS